MSHELTTNAITGQVEFAYRLADGLPWHGLGQPMQDGASIDDWRVAAGMDWKIQRSKIRYAVAHGVGPDSFKEMADQHVLFRSDTKDALGIVSEKYKVVQPRDVIEFFRDIAKAGGLELSAAGTIYGGRRFWATAKIGEASPTSVKDMVGGFILISTSADGSLATEIRRTSVRVVCRNTLAMAFEGKASHKVSHKSVFDPEQIKGYMGLNEAAWEAFRHNIVRMAETPVDGTKAEELTLALLGGAGAGPDIEAKVTTSVAFNKILALFNGEGKGANLDGVHGTGWGWVNAVTEYQDWFARARTEENRFVSSQWGPGADVKARAVSLVEALSQ
jgi:phage/plasmid-like protein (TIGR03299 family)